MPESYLTKTLRYMKVYKCSECGCDFFTKFQNYDKCITCLGPVFEEIEEKLKHNKYEKIDFAKNWKGKKEKENKEGNENNVPRFIKKRR